MPDPAIPEPTPPITVSAPHFTDNLFAVLEETFARTRGIYLDGGADLFATLAELSAEEASRNVHGTTIAAQVFHTAFYMRAMDRYFEGFEGKTDWEESWTTRTVTRAEWERLRAQLRDDYDRATRKLRAVTNWDEAALDFGMTVAVHSAYHLGAVRQLAKAVKGAR
jgi:hypothetical protein